MVVKQDSQFAAVGNGAHGRCWSRLLVRVEHGASRLTSPIPSCAQTHFDETIIWLEVCEGRLGEGADMEVCKYGSKVGAACHAA